ncbi:MAG: hypothetical protein P8N65_00635, partial [SAR86 cluster bacterium]|nr:hypothetical protein [SAR86 cluster bacterium]
SGSGECIVKFEDDNYFRDTVYYVRAIQEATPAINGAPLSEREEFKLCKGSFRTNLEDDCLSLSNERHIIDRIEVIKVTPQSYAGEAISPLIQDAWKVIPCSGSGECIVKFEDDNYFRDTVYYVRAIQEAAPAINGAPLSEREEFKLCKGSFRTNLEDDCLSMSNERAWSSPIYVNKP